MSKFTKDISLFQVVVLVLLGACIAVSSFLTYEYITFKKTNEQLRNDIITIVQSYNNLIMTLQDQKVLPSQNTEAK